MEFRDLIRVVKVNLPLVVSSIITSFLLSAIVTFTISPLYTSSARLFISIPGSALDISSLATGSSFAEARVKSYAKIVDGPLTLLPVIKKLNLSYSVEQLASMVSADAPLGTVLVDISVENSDSNLASNLANSVAAQFALTVAELEFASAGTESPVKVTLVKYATPSGKASSPNKIANLLIGVLFGFGIGVGLALLRRLLDLTVKSEIDLLGYPLLAAMVFDPEAANKPLTSQMDKYSVRVETYRLLRTNLQFISPENPPQVIAIASALPGEGKTTSSLNLSLALVVSGFKVLLIECDLRRPKVSTYLGVAKSKPGLSELLVSRSRFEFRPFVQHFFPNPLQKQKIDFIAAGAIPPNPSELLNSDRFTSLIKFARENYDYVILDSSPILPVADASLVATHSDGVLMIVGAGTTKKSQFSGAVDAICGVNSKILGVMLNRIPRDSRRAQDYGYKYGYAGAYSESYSRYYSDLYGYSYGENQELLAYAPLLEQPPKIKVSTLTVRIVNKIRSLKKKIE